MDQFFNQLLSFKDQKIGIAEEREDDLKVQMVKLYDSCQVAVEEAEVERKKRIDAESGHLAAEQRLSQLTEAMDTLKRHVQELEAGNGVLRDALYAKANKTKKIQELNELGKLIETHRKKQILNN